MDEKLNWSYVHSFLAVMERGSLSAAARHLGMSQPTMGRHIDELEKSFGGVLFVRNQNGFVATPLAQSLLPRAREMANIADEMIRTVSRFEENGEISGLVRLSASEVVGVEVLPPILSQLRKQFPNVLIELVASDTPADLLHSEVDIAIRMFRPSQNQLIARRIGDFHFGFFVHRDYLEQQGTPSNLAELFDHTLVGFDSMSDYLRTHASKFPAPLKKEIFQYRSDNTIAQLAMIRAGVGIGVAQIGVLKHDTNLVQLLPDSLDFSLDVWITMHEDLKRNRVCKAVFDYLAEQLIAYQQRITS